MAETEMNRDFLSNDKLWCFLFFFYMLALLFFSHDLGEILYLLAFV